MKFYFHTNLDEPRLPTMMEELFGSNIPAIGSYISIPYHGYELELEVVSHRFRVHKTISPINGSEINTVSLKVELHIPKIDNCSIADWEDRLRRMRENTNMVRKIK